MASTAVNNGQAVLSFRCGTLQAGILLSVLDAKGNVVFAFENPKTIQSVVLSTPALVAGDTYTILTGGSLDTSAVDGIYQPGDVSGGETLGSLTAQ